MSKLISVVVPVFNAERFLSLCVESILNQDYNDLEIILVNDGSKDKSLEICHGFSDKRIVVVDKENGGVSSARNKGIEIAHGQYIAFVDSDDTLPQDSLSTLVDILEKENADVAIGSFMFQYGDKYQPHAPRLKQGTYLFQDLLPNFIDDGTLSGFLIGSVWGGVYKTDVIKSSSLHFNHEIKNNEDGLFNFEYALKTNKLSVTSKCVYYYRQYGASSTSFRKETYDYNKLIMEYILTKVPDENVYDIKTQFKRRSVSLALWDILKYPAKQNFVEGMSYIKTKISSNEVREGLLHMSIDKMPRYKKVFYYLMKSRMVLCTLFLVKYFIPRFSSRITR